MEFMSKLVNKSNEEVKPSFAGKIVGLYFSAHWVIHIIPYNHSLSSSSSFLTIIFIPYHFLSSSLFLTIIIIPYHHHHSLPSVSFLIIMILYYLHHHHSLSSSSFLTIFIIINIPYHH
jgi:hypothetical protein